MMKMRSMCLTAVLVGAFTVPGSAWAGTEVSMLQIENRSTQKAEGGKKIGFGRTKRIKVQLKYIVPGGKKHETEFEKLKFGKKHTKVYDLTTLGIPVGSEVYLKIRGGREGESCRKPGRKLFYSPDGGVARYKANYDDEDNTSFKPGGPNCKLL